MPSWFASMLEVRNKQISDVTNKLQQLERQKQQAEGHLRVRREGNSAHECPPGSGSFALSEKGANRQGAAAAAACRA